jgi:hypothetical protein
MCFFHGEEDKEGTKLAKALHDNVINKGNKLKTTFRVPMPKTNLSGSELLKGNMGTEDFIARCRRHPGIECRRADETEPRVDLVSN